MEKVNIKGIYRDVLVDQQRRIIHDSGWVSNTIVNTCRILLASFMKGNLNDLSAGATGIQYLVVGQGDPAWDGHPMSPQLEDRDLFDKTTNRFELRDFNLAYLDESNHVVDTPTHRLQIKTMIKAGEPPGETYALREFGLFGRFGGEEYMINYVIHPVIHKDKLTELTRTIRLFF